mgnify:CR=1 FL=1
MDENHPPAVSAEKHRSRNVIAQELTQGYSTDETLIRGAIVGLNAEDNNKVETINSER